MIDKFIHMVVAVIARGIVGTLTGLFAGVLSGAVTSLLVALATNDSGAMVIMVAVVLAGGGIGASIVGMFVAWLTNLADYKSQTGIEWGVVGATSAFFVSWLVQLPFAITVVLIAMYVASAIVVYRIVLALFEDEHRVSRITLKSAIAYCFGILVTSGAIFIAFKGFESIID